MTVRIVAGSTTLMELTGHPDLGGDSLPTLLNMWRGSHYRSAVLAGAGG